jgi:hypothetical protein
MDCIFLWAVVFIGFNSYKPAVDSALAVFFFSTKLSLGGDCQPSKTNSFERKKKDLITNRPN